MRDTEPSVSTAGRRRMIALRCAMRCTPIASVTVISAGRPSGMSDTAMLTIAWNISTNSMPRTHRPKANTITPTTAMTRGDRVAELLDLAQQRRLERADPGHHLVDAAELGVGAGRDHDARPAPGRDQRARERHAFAVADGGLLGHGFGGLVDGHRLAGERRLLGPQVLDVDEAQVRRDLVARFEQHDIARAPAPRPGSGASRRRAARGPRPTACCGSSRAPSPPCLPGGSRAGR